MRNLLKRSVERDQPKVPLRERLDAVKTRLAAGKAKAGQIAGVGRILSRPVPGSAPPVHRAALVNYSTFLALERERIQAELYPHKNRAARWFVRSLNEAWAFFHDGRDSARPRLGLLPASTRAVRVLDLVGIDWRADRDANRCKPDSDDIDDGTRWSLPLGTPAPDAALVEALDDLVRLDAAIVALLDTSPRDRAYPDVPGWRALEAARDGALSRIGKTRAETLTGLQAKARALLTPTIHESYSEEGDRLTDSLLTDLLGASNRSLEPWPDPIFAALAEYDRLNAMVHADAPTALAIGDPTPEHDALCKAVIAHWRNVVLKTVPRTAEGCKVLARATAAHHREWACTMDCGDGEAAFALIARSPLL